MDRTKAGRHKIIISCRRIIRLKSSQSGGRLVYYDRFELWTTCFELHEKQKYWVALNIGSCQKTVKHKTSEYKCVKVRLEIHLKTPNKAPVMKEGITTYGVIALPGFIHRWHLHLHAECLILQQE